MIVRTPSTTAFGRHFRWLRLVALTAIVALTVAATTAAPASASTSAAPVLAGPCEREVDIYKQNNTIHAYAVQVCESAPPNQLTVALEVWVCDAGGCLWATWKSGLGTVTQTCNSTLAGAKFRNSRLPTKTVRC